MNRKLKKIIAFIFILSLIIFICVIIFNLLDNSEIKYDIAINKMLESEEKIKSDLSTGTTYYISCDGTSTDGTDINNPMSLTQAKTKTYGNDDRILFKRGDTFYGTISLTLNNTDGFVYIGAYGEGERPIISGANILIDPEAWIKENNIYKIDLYNSENFVGIGQLNWEPYNIAFIEDENGNIYGDRKRYLNDLTENFDFYCENQFLYMKLDENPSELLGRLKFVQRCDLVKISSNMIIEDLNIQNCGAHAISKKNETIENVYIKNCIIQNIGGSLQVPESFTRYGNGIEFWNQAKNTLVENCILRNIFDTGYTLQGDSNLDGFENNIFRNNILINCSYDTEIFSYDKNNPGKQSKIERYIYENNISINQGRGWGYEHRNDTRVASVLVFWANDTLPDKADITMRDNIYFNFRNLYYTYNVYNNPVSNEKYKSVLKSENNKLYMAEDSTILCGEGNYANTAVLEKIRSREEF